MAQKRGLGRGIGALIGDTIEEQAEPLSAEEVEW